MAYASTGSLHNDNKCVPALGQQAPGEPCMVNEFGSGIDDCDASSQCWDVTENAAGELVGVCYLICPGTGDDPQCPDQHYCATNANATIAYCKRICDPFEQDCDQGRLAISFLSFPGLSALPRPPRSQREMPASSSTTASRAAFACRRSASPAARRRSAAPSFASSRRPTSANPCCRAPAASLCSRRDRSRVSSTSACAPASDPPLRRAPPRRAAHRQRSPAVASVFGSA